MEKNHYGDTILGVVVTEHITEGLMVCLTSHSVDHNFGSYTDVPGCKLPASKAEADRSKYIITFAPDNRPTPLYYPQPHYDWSTRWGWEQAANVPFVAAVYLTHQDVQEGGTIPSGSGAIAFGEGIYTIPSGSYVYDPAMQTPGCQLEVAYTNPNRGKLTVLVAGTVVGETVRYHTDGHLTFKLFD